METGEINLLLTDNENIDEDKLQKIWNDLEEQHQKINPNSQNHKTLNLYQQINSLLAKQNSIQLAVQVLWHIKDKELLQLLKGFGYQLYFDCTKKEYRKRLEKISKQSEAIETKVSMLKRRLPKEPEENKSNTTLDETILNYSSFIGSGFIDTNKITVTQYYSLVKIGNNKLKQLKKQEIKSKKNGRR